MGWIVFYFNDDDISLSAVDNNNSLKFLQMDCWKVHAS